jgi:predicted nucleic acid-binding protein
MMIAIIDADVLIDVVKGNVAARDALAEARAAGVHLWSVAPVRAEILRGVFGSEIALATGLLDVLEWLDVNADLADRAGEIGRPFVRSHQGISITDLLLAAAVERVGGQLLTRNVRHFPMFPGLRPAY